MIPLIKGRIENQPFREQRNLMKILRKRADFTHHGFYGIKDTGLKI